jgi:hypothetical protein
MVMRSATAARQAKLLRAVGEHKQTSHPQSHADELPRLVFFHARQQIDNAQRGAVLGAVLGITKLLAIASQAALG